MTPNGLDSFKNDLAGDVPQVRNSSFNNQEGRPRTFSHNHDTRPRAYSKASSNNTVRNAPSDYIIRKETVILGC